jgi:hypothetical protein
MKRIAGLILAGGMMFGLSPSAKAQVGVMVGNPYGYGSGLNPYGYGGYGMPATTFYSSGYSGFVGGPAIGGYGYRPYGYGYGAYGYRPYGYGYRGYGYRPFGGRGWGRRWR